jgi:hypothetical protein
MTVSLEQKLDDMAEEKQVDKSEMNVELTLIVDVEAETKAGQENVKTAMRAGKEIKEAKMDTAINSVKERMEAAIKSARIEIEETDHQQSGRGRNAKQIPHLLTVLQGQAADISMASLQKQRRQR